MENTNNVSQFNTQQLTALKPYLIYLFQHGVTLSNIGDVWRFSFTRAIEGLDAAHTYTSLDNAVTGLMGVLAKQNIAGVKAA